MTCNVCVFAYENSLVRNDDIYQLKAGMEFTMNEIVYNKYKLQQIEKSDGEDSLLLFVNQLVQLKDKKRINLFWDADEEAVMRSYLRVLKDFSGN